MKILFPVYKNHKMRRVHFDLGHVKNLGKGGAGAPHHVFLRHFLNKSVQEGCFDALGAFLLDHFYLLKKRCKILFGFGGSKNHRGPGSERKMTLEGLNHFFAMFFVRFLNRF